MLRETDQTPGGDRAGAGGVGGDAGEGPSGGGGGGGGGGGAWAGTARVEEWSERFFYLSGHFLRYKKHSRNLTSVNLKQVIYSTVTQVLYVG